MGTKKMTANKYGVLETETEFMPNYCSIKENIIRRGFSIVDSGFSAKFLSSLRQQIDKLKGEYIENYSLSKLKLIDEHNTLRAPFLNSPIFLKVAFNKKLIQVLSNVLGNNFILNQQNVIINPAKEAYNQNKWHRDLPYQHFVSSRPLAINALFCLDDFTSNNGATFVMPGSHNHERFPSEKYVMNEEIQVSAPAGSYIILDSMLYHKGGNNKSNSSRIGINNVFSSPMIRRQIDFSENDFCYKISHLDNVERLGMNFKSFHSVASFINNQITKIKK